MKISKLGNQLERGRRSIDSLSNLIDECRRSLGHEAKSPQPSRVLKTTRTLAMNTLCNAKIFAVETHCDDADLSAVSPTMALSERREFG
jgi:hypothetical protein